VPCGARAQASGDGLGDGLGQQQRCIETAPIVPSFRLKLGRVYK
jgi:hypothetical protein